MSPRSSYAAHSARHVPVYSCGSLHSSYLQLRDAIATWETFDESALVKYFTTGMKEIRVRMNELGDLSYPLDEEERKELFFMLESLVFVRTLLVEDVEEFMDEEDEL